MRCGRRTASKAQRPKRITDAIYDAGFGSSSRLYEGSGEALGMTPRVMREGGAGLVIRYATAASPLGRMLVAATAVGVCAIAFGRDDAELVSDLRGRFNRAELVAAKGNTGWLAEAVAFVASQMSEHPLAATFPLDVRATAFQQRVWKALREIPRGETRSYAEVAREIGQADGRARSCGGVRGEPGGGCGAVPSRGGEGWEFDGISVGGREEAQAAGGGGCGCARVTQLVEWCDGCWYGDCGG